jgi:hypothetical protein
LSISVSGSGTGSQQCGKNPDDPRVLRFCLSLRSHNKNRWNESLHVTILEWRRPGKVFGGANQYAYSNNAFNIGERNVHLALHMLEESNIPVIASSVGGGCGRKILFECGSGQVLMKYITQNNLERKPLL